MKRFLIIAVLLLMSCSAWSFEYVGLGFGPNLHLKGDRPSSFFIQGEWQPHKVLGTKLFLGFENGFWLGVAMNFKQNLAKIGRGTIWDINFSIPFIFNITNSLRVAFVGITVGTTLSFNIDGKDYAYFFVTPFDVLFTPWGWLMYPAGGWKKEESVSYMCSAGFRFAI